jgi:putative nucleotidyltransferase with HDIG domain
VIDPKILSADARSLPPLSQALVALLRLLRQRDVTASQLEQAILRDAALSANILRIANSPWFGLKRQVSSLSHAVTLIGQSRIQELATTMSYLSTLPKELPGYGISQTGFLVHSIAVGFLAERIGTVTLQAPGTPLFVAGLLHDIGKLVLARHLAEQKAELVEGVAHHLTLVAAERDLLGTDHTEVAAFVGNAWQLPAEVTSVAGGHHTPSAHVDNPHSNLIDVVHVADITAHALGYGRDIAGLARAPDPETFQRLKIRPSVIERIVSECLEALVDTCRAATTEEPLT